MKSRTIKLIFSLAAAALALFASVSAASACLFGWYQPEVPKALREE